MNRLHRAHDWLLTGVLRPLFAAAPRWLWPLLAWLLAFLHAPWAALTQAPRLDAILQASGRRPGLKARLALGRGMLYWRLRRLDFYFWGQTDRCTVVWEGDAPDQVLACYVLMDSLGAEQVCAWANGDAFLIVRRRFGREDPDARGAPAWQSHWLEHCDRLRGNLMRKGIVDPARGAAELRRLYQSERNLLFFQGSPSQEPGSPVRQWMGQRVPIVLGAVRLARRKSLPIRFVQVTPTLTGWKIVVEPAVAPDEGWLLARMARQLRECPQSWSLWADFWITAERHQTSVPRCGDCCSQSSDAR